MTPRTMLAVNLASRLVLFGIKLWAFFATGFLVLLGEALNSLVDGIVTGSLLLAERVGHKGGDPEHPFGHRRARHVISLMVAVTFVTVTSLQLLREAIPRLFDPVLPGEPGLAYAVLWASFAVNFAPLLAFYAGRQRGDILIKTARSDTLNDQVTILAALGGVWLAAQGVLWADPAAAILVAMLIAVNGALLMRENGKFLLGRSPGPEFYDRVERAVLDVRGVEGVHDMIAEYIGPDTVHMDMDIEVDPELTVREADVIDRRVKARLRELGVLSAEVHPCAHRGDLRKIHREL